MKALRLIFSYASSAKREEISHLKLETCWSEFGRSQRTPGESFEHDLVKTRMIILPPTLLSFWTHPTASEATKSLCLFELDYGGSNRNAIEINTTMLQMCQCLRCIQPTTLIVKNVYIILSFLTEKMSTKVYHTNDKTPTERLSKNQKLFGQL